MTTVFFCHTCPGQSGLCIKASYHTLVKYYSLVQSTLGHAILHKKETVYHNLMQQGADSWSIPRVAVQAINRQSIPEAVLTANSRLMKCTRSTGCNKKLQVERTRSNFRKQEQETLASCPYLPVTRSERKSIPAYTSPRWQRYHGGGSTRDIQGQGDTLTSGSATTRSIFGVRQPFTDMANKLLTCPITWSVAAAAKLRSVRRPCAIGDEQ